MPARERGCCARAGSRSGENLGGPSLGGPRAGGAARAEPTLPVRSTPSCSGTAKSTAELHPVPGLPSFWNAGVSWLGHASWSATFLEISVYIDKLLDRRLRFISSVLEGEGAGLLLVFAGFPSNTG